MTQTDFSSTKSWVSGSNATESALGMNFASSYIQKHNSNYNIKISKQGAIAISLKIVKSVLCKMSWY